MNLENNDPNNDYINEIWLIGRLKKVSMRVAQDYQKLEEPAKTIARQELLRYIARCDDFAKKEQKSEGFGNFAFITQPALEEIINDAKAGKITRDEDLMLSLKK